MPNVVRKISVHCAAKDMPGCLFGASNFDTLNINFLECKLRCESRIRSTENLIHQYNMSEHTLLIIPMGNRRRTPPCDSEYELDFI